MKRKTKEDFIQKAKKIHNNKYDYSLVEYKNNKTNVQLICKLHGVFEIRPDNHLNKKSGCPKCYNHQSKTNKEFIDKSSKIHNNKYDYSLVEYKNDKTTVKIICPIHGIFKQTPNHHYKKGCYLCLVENRKIKFLEKSHILHGDKYDYSLVEYINSTTPIKIICSIHGIFNQIPMIHTMKDGSGCPNCKRSKGEEKIEKYLIKNNILFINQKKFSDCKDKFPLPFDFYLFESNICIEYDGELHFNRNQHFGGIERLKYYQKHDEIKTDYCKNNNIKLLRIKYNQDIEKSLNNFLFS